MKTSAFLSIFRQEYINDPGTEIVKIFKDAGFSGIEPCHWGFTFLRNDNPIEKAKELRERRLKEGLDCPCYSRGMTLTDANALSELKAAVDVAVELGSPLLHHTIYMTSSNKNLPLWDSMIDKFVPVAREIAYYAGERGITCVYEDQGFLAGSADRLGEFLAKIDMENTGINLDVGNAFDADADPYEIAARLGSFIKHVHIKDLLVKPFDQIPDTAQGWDRSVGGAGLRYTIVGHGVVDFEKIFTTLLLAGYDGYYTLESGGLEKNIHESLANMESMYNNAKAKLIRKGLIKE